jgi:hypothetical protein
LTGTDGDDVIVGLGGNNDIVKGDQVHDLVYGVGIGSLAVPETILCSVVLAPVIDSMDGEGSTRASIRRAEQSERRVRPDEPSRRGECGRAQALASKMESDPPCDKRMRPE